MIHTASLVHDDVLDECNVRRGVPCLASCLCSDGDPEHNGVPRTWNGTLDALLAVKIWPAALGTLPASHAAFTALVTSAQRTRGSLKGHQA